MGFSPILLQSDRKKVTKNGKRGEKQRKNKRRYPGSEAESLGFGGMAIVSKISDKSGNTIVAGMKETVCPMKVREESEGATMAGKQSGRNILT
jgi:hypothetical protein